MNGVHTVFRFVRTAGYLQPRQLYWRLRYALRKKYGHFPPLDTPESDPKFDQEVLASLRRFLRTLGEFHLPEEDKLAAWRSGSFCFQRQSVPGTGDAGDVPPWHAPEQNPLWQYQIHYFDYARDLALAHVAKPMPADGRKITAWMHAWIEAHPPGASPGWDAYPTARRIINWALAIAAFGLDDDVIARSIHQQAQWLNHSIEYHLGGNHLLNNAVGLILAGAVLDESFSESGLSLLKKELIEQILPDGGHYERSPLYHCQVLEDLLISWAALPTPPDFIPDVLKSMGAFLQHCRHPDGDIPLFGDAALKVTPPAWALLGTLQKLLRLSDPTALPEAASLESSGYYLFSLGAESRMIMKAGPPGPRYQLGHAHCDCLSFELSIEGKRVIVDAGTHGYAQSPYRDYNRSTRAHNTLQINQQEQLDYWADFRVARRYRLLHLLWGGGRLEASHDGFWPFVHHREAWVQEHCCWVVRDRVTGPESCCATSWLHFHPDMQLSEEAGCWRIQGQGVDAALVPFGVENVECLHGATEPLQGWYSPEFGLAQPQRTLAFWRTEKPGAYFGYVIFPTFQEALKSLARQEGDKASFIEALSAVS